MDHEGRAERLVVRPLLLQAFLAWLVELQALPQHLFLHLAGPRLEEEVVRRILRVEAGLLHKAWEVEDHQPVLVVAVPLLLLLVGELDLLAWLLLLPPVVQIRLEALLLLRRQVFRLAEPLLVLHQAQLVLPTDF